MPTPIVNPNEITQQVPAARPEEDKPSGDDETTMLPRVTDERSGRGGSGGRDGRDAREARDARDTRDTRDTRDARAADETAGLPPVRADQPSDRVPKGYFRDEGPASPPAESENERTRELPQVEDPRAAGQAGDESRARRKRPRPDWAEETPLDDLPTLADELLGGQDDDDRPTGRGRRPRG